MSPLDDFRALTRDLPGPDASALARMAERPPRADEPAGGLGRMETIAIWLAGWTGRTPPQVTRPVIALYVGAHGAAPGQGRERRRLETLAAGDAPVNAMAQRLGAGLDVFDLAVDRPVGDPTLGPSMSERECAATLAFGMEALAKSPDLLLVGEAGGGGRVAVDALTRALLGDDDGEDAAAAAVARVRDERVVDPLQLLRHLGGREIAALTGAILAARVQRTPVILDGPAAAAAAAVLHALNPGALDHCLAGHAVDAAHRGVLDRLGLSPLLDLDIVLGEGVGATAALSLVQLACAAVANG